MSVVHEVLCDRCGEPFGTSYQTPELALKSAIEEGWRHDAESGGDWCPSCQAEAAGKGGALYLLDEDAEARLHAAHLARERAEEPLCEHGCSAEDDEPCPEGCAFCQTCTKPYSSAGDGGDGECPECADKTAIADEERAKNRGRS